MKRYSTYLLLGIFILLLILTNSGEASQIPNVAPRMYLPMISYNVSPPPSSTSYYVKDISSSALWDLGCSLALQMAPESESRVATILHFGQPWQNTSGVYGTRIFDPSVSFVSRSQIETGARSFALAYGVCSTFYSNNTLLNLGIGLNNYGAYVNYAHGSTWGDVVDTISNSLIGSSAENKVFVVGANDMELGFNTSTVTKDWVVGYFSQSIRYLYNFGTADGCPYQDVIGDGLCGTVEYPDWHQSDVWFITSGRAGSRAFPEIYAVNGVNAAQWYQIAMYGYRTGVLFPFIARGALTQYEACNQRPSVPDDPSTPNYNENRGCHPSDPYLKNTPAQGWNQFFVALRGNSQTSQNVHYSSDIKWPGE